MNFFKKVCSFAENFKLALTFYRCLYNNNNNNNNNSNNHDNVYGAVIMAQPLREFTRFI